MLVREDLIRLSTELQAIPSKASGLKRGTGGSPDFKSYAALFIVSYKPAKNSSKIWRGKS